MKSSKDIKGTDKTAHNEGLTMEGNDKRMKDGSDRAALYARCRAMRKSGKLYQWRLKQLPYLGSKEERTEAIPMDSIIST